MHRLRSLICALPALAIATVAAPGHAADLPGEAPAATRAAFQQLIEQRTARMIANGKAGRKTDRSDADAAYVAVGEDGGVKTKPDDGSDFLFGADEAKLASKVEDLHVQLHGDTAVVVYRLDLSLEFNGEPCLKPFRVTEVFRKAGSGWRVIAYQETVIPGRPSYVAKIDPKLLDDYAGSYRILPSIAYSINRKGDRLFWDDTELFAESDSTFATEGAADYRLLFLRDHDGRVTGMRIRELSGVEYTAVRVPAPHG